MATFRHHHTMGRMRPLLLALLDLLCINVAYIAVAMLGYGWHFIGLPKSVWLIVNVAFLPVMVYYAVVHSRRYRLIRSLMFAAFKGLIAFGIFIFLAVWITYRTCFPLSFYFIYFAVCLAIIWCLWLLEHFLIPDRWNTSDALRRVAIIGTGNIATHIYSTLAANPGSYDIVGFVGDSDETTSLPKKILGPVKQLDEIVKTHNIDTLYLTAENDDEVIVKKAMAVADENICRFFYAPSLAHIVKRNFFVAPLDGAMPVLDLYPNPLQNPVNRFFKRAFDICFSSIVLSSLIIPVFIPVAIAIKLSSPGPVFFKQKRTGFRGRDFYCYKFRTMKVNNESDIRATSKDDERKTRVGDFLRRTSIDELPQFWNALIGNMSVVGPRPHMVSFTEHYRQVIGQYMIRLLIKPGITGWAQANGYRGNTDELWKMEKRVESDVWYIEHWSFWLDIKIICKTFINIIHGDENAY